MIDYIYGIIYKFLLTKHVIDHEYISALHVVSNPNFDIWFNADGYDKEKKLHCLKELNNYLENIKIISNYILSDHSQEDARQKLLDSLKQPISTAYILAYLLEHDPHKYNEIVSGAKEYSKSRKEFLQSVSKENEEITTEYKEAEDNQYDDLYNPEDYYVTDINITNQTNITEDNYE